MSREDGANVDDEGNRNVELEWKKKTHFFIQIIGKSILHLNRGANKLHHIPFV